MAFQLADGEFDALQARYGVSRETLERLVVYAEQLARWSKTINLIGPGTAQDIWSRHILDSLQMVGVASGLNLSKGEIPLQWVDFGTGAGLPGMVIASLGEYHVTMVESNRKKTAFLRNVKPMVAPYATIIDQRIEEFVIEAPAPSIVSARAVAHLSTLFDWLAPWLGTEMVLLFPKGREYEKELAESRVHWHYDCTVHPSAIDPQSVILEIRHLKLASVPTG